MFKYRIKLGRTSVWGWVLYASTMRSAKSMASYYGPGSKIELI